MKKKKQRWVAWFAIPKTYSTKREMITAIGSQIVMYGRIFN